MSPAAGRSGKDTDMGYSFRKAQEFIYRNARPLGMALWQHHFENKGAQGVLRALAFYQNADGGFGHALETDCWNPGSSPMQTWSAAEILRGMGYFNHKYPLVGSMLAYLSGGSDFDGHLWRDTVPGNNDHPHAPWWTYPTDADYNPTASLAGLLVRAAPKGSGAETLGLRLAGEAVGFFLRGEALQQHTLACFVQLYEYLAGSGAAEAFPMREFAEKLREAVSEGITRDTGKWATDYVYKPSFFIGGKNSPYYEDNRKLAEYECEFIKDTQLEDGSWSVNWAWGAYPEQWPVARNWWKADIILKNLLYLKGMERL